MLELLMAPMIRPTMLAQHRVGRHNFYALKTGQTFGEVYKRMRECTERNIINVHGV